MLALLATLPLLAPPGWTPVAPGVSHRPLDGGHAYRLDLRLVELRVAEARSHGRTGMTAAELAAGTGATLAVNGGFFAPDYRPLGLLVSRGRTLNRLRRADWGVLWVRNGRSHVLHSRAYRHRPHTEFAIQAGPRLVVRGKPLHFKAQSARRTALGVLPGGRELVLVVLDRRVSTLALAELLSGPLGCRWALNLDGGSSTQLWSKAHRVQGLPVANAVLVVPRAAAPGGR